MLSFLHPHSREVGKAELNLFGIPSTQTQVPEHRVDSVKASASSLAGENPIEWEVEGASPEEYIDMRNSDVHISFQIVRVDGAPMTEKDTVSLVNNGMHSMFSGIEVKFNNTLVAQHMAGAYAYRAYFKNTLNFGTDSKRVYLPMQLYFNDECADNAPCLFYAIDEGLRDHPREYGVAGVNRRGEETKNGRITDVLGNLLEETLALDRYLLSGVKVRISLIRARSRFALVVPRELDADDYRIKIVEATFNAKIKRLGREHALAIESTLVEKPAKYFINRTVMLHRIISKDTFAQHFPRIYDSVRPKRITLALVKHRAFIGDSSENPFAFGHFHLRQITVAVGGRTLPECPLKMRYDENEMTYKQAYQNLYNAMGKSHSDKPIGISLKQFINGYAIYMFDCTPDGSAASPYASLVSSGAIDITLEFDKALENDLQMLVLLEVNGLIQIDAQRNVTVDYSLIT